MSLSRLPASSIFRHFACLTVCLLAAAGVWYLGALRYGVSGWADTVDYITVGKSIVLDGRFPLAPIPYQDFLAAGSAGYGPGSPLLSYPNLGFTTAIGLIGLFTGQFTLMNGIILNAVFSLLFAAVAYCAAWSLLRDRFMAVLFPCALLLHRLAFPALGGPLTEASLLVFLTAGMWAMLKGYPFASGLLLGIGFLFREHALLFFPLLPLLHPEAVSLKGYGRALLAASGGFLPCLALSKAAGVLLSDGRSFSDFYVDEAVRTLTLTPERLKRFIKHAGIIFRVAWPPLLLFLYCLARRRVSPVGLRLMAFGLLPALAVAFQWSYKGLPERYLMYSLLPFYLAVFLSLAHRDTFSGLREKAVLLGLLVVLTVAAQGKYVAGELAFFARSKTTLADVSQKAGAPLGLRQVFPAGSVLLAGMMTEYAIEDGIAVTPPEFAVFCRNNNAGIDGIIVRNGWKDWPDVDHVRDDHGTIFTRVDIPGATLPPELLYFAKGKGPCARTP